MSWARSRSRKVWPARPTSSTAPRCSRVATARSTGSGRAVGDGRRRQRAPVASAWSWSASRALAGRREQLAVPDQRAPFGQELLPGLRDEPLAERGGAPRLAELGGRLESVEAGVGEAPDDPDLLDRRAVDLLDLADEHREQLDVAESDRELVDDDALAALEHVDADDVAAHRTDPGGHESRAHRADPGARRAPARLLTHPCTPPYGILEIVSGYGHVNGIAPGV